jgi:hypothetical protein
MHTAWRDELCEQEQWDFLDELRTVVTASLPESEDSRIDSTVANATALQRAEAFLRLKGKWKSA